MRHGGVFQVNREHTRLNELYLEELSREPSDPARAESDEDARRLSAFLGMPELREADYNRRPFLLCPGDVLLLCSDGLSNIVTDQELLYEAIHGGEPSDCCQRLLHITLSRGAPDNVTAVLFQIV